MQELIQQLPEVRHSPRLWFERLTLFREVGPDHVLRTVTFRRGLNIVWAKEPVAGSAIGVRAAGHGVGKTSLCLLLRLCLGDTAKAVSEVREELFVEFPQGCVAAVLHVEGQVFTLLRHFNAYKEGIALEGDDINALWGEENGATDRSFIQNLSDTMMAKVAPRVIPETDQAIEWRHLLAWISRDQGSRFKSFFSWREGEGTGLQRSRQDPPIIMRAVLGLLDQAESSLMSRLAELETDLELAKKQTAALLHEPVLIRRRIESDLRAWRNLPDSLPMHAEDLFTGSVVQEVRNAADSTASILQDWNERQDEAEQNLAKLRAEVTELQTQLNKASLEYDYVEAARVGDEDAYKTIGVKLLRLTQLAGDCQEGNVPFSKCRHIQAEVERLQVTNLRDERDKKSLSRAMEESASRAVSVLQRKKHLEVKIKSLGMAETELVGKRNKIREVRDKTSHEARRGEELLVEMERWEKSAGSSVSQAAIDQSRAKSDGIARDINSTRTQLAIVQKDLSTREKRIASIMDHFTGELLSNDAFGAFDPRDESRPFRISMRGGEAYRVLEVLLGDIACLMESAGDGNAFPGLVIHDCPREADMSAGLYEGFLLLTDRLQKAFDVGANIPFQYIVTTTTPPPEELIGSEQVCLVLDPSFDDGMLFKRRFSEAL
ncbi:hypothetical protein [Pseudomonas spelaei]